MMLPLNRLAPVVLALAASAALCAAAGAQGAAPGEAQGEDGSVSEGAPPAASAQRVEEGAAVAQRWCASCHVVGEAQQSQALDGAPSFPDIAQRGAGSPAALRRALIGNHPVMPQFPVTERQITALSAYIASLAPTAEAERDAKAPAIPAPKPAAAGASDSASAGEAAGEKILVANCSPCHALEGGPSPVAHAPVFATLSERYRVTDLEEALAEGIAVGHGEVEMPEFRFEPDEIAAIIAFLSSIQAR